MFLDRRNTVAALRSNEALSEAHVNSAILRDVAELTIGSLAAVESGGTEGSTPGPGCRSPPPARTADRVGGVCKVLRGRDVTEHAFWLISGRWS